MNTKKIYNKISKTYLYWIIEDLCQASLHKGMIEEVRLTLEKKNVILSDENISNLINGDYTTPNEHPFRVGITVSTDMGWQK